MSELQQNIKAVSFGEDVNSLTFGQTLIIKLLSDRLKEGKPVSKQDITDVYCRAMAPKGQKNRWQYQSDGSWKNTAVTLKDHWSAHYYSGSWFMRNLGACIIKGKILAIPLIET